MASEATDDLENHEHPEKQPLLRHAGHALLDREVVTDAMTYHTADLASWSSLFYASHTVFNRRSLWMSAVKLWLISMLVALIVAAVVRDPVSFRAGKFNTISSFLRVFVGLLLGFFMSASVNRWWACVEAFLGLGAAVRKMQMILLSCDTPVEETQHCLRYGVLSAWLLSLELHVQALPHSEQAAAKQKGWEELLNGDGHDHVFAALRLDESSVLRSVKDPPGTLWIWVGTYLGGLQRKGHISALAGPVFARCMTIASEGLDKIIRVRSCISVQAPFIYVQMLSSLVHINNIVNALSFGLTTGVAAGTLLIHNHIHIFSNKEASGKEATLDVQSLIVSFFFSCFGPFVYQALLEVSIAIAQPFSNNHAIVPTQRILKELEDDLHDAMMAKCTPRSLIKGQLIEPRKLATVKGTGHRDDGESNADDDDAD